MNKYSWHFIDQAYLQNEWMNEYVPIWVTVWTIELVQMINSSYIFIHFQDWFSAPPRVAHQIFWEVCLFGIIFGCIFPPFGHNEGMVVPILAHRDTFDRRQSSHPTYPSVPLENQINHLLFFSCPPSLSSSLPFSFLFICNFKICTYQLTRVMPGVWGEVVMLLISNQGRRRS